MKKTVSAISFIIMVCMILLPNALGEDFSLHSGVMFGMTEDEVFSTEQNNGFQRGDNESWAANVIGSVAGFDDSTIYYGFDSSGALITSSYSIGQNRDASRYNTILAALEAKYGQPAFDANSIILFEDFDGDNILLNYYSSLSSLLSTKVNDFKQWIIPINNGYVNIMTISFYVKAKPEVTEVWVSYDYITEEQYKSEIVSLEQKADELANDL